MAIKMTREEYQKEFGQAPFLTQSAKSTSSKGVAQRLSDTGMEMREKVSGNISGTGEYANKSLLNRGIGATAAVFSAVPKGAMDLAPEPVRKGLNYVGEKIGKGFNSLTGKIADTDLFKGAAGNQVMGADGLTSYVPNDTSRLENTLGTVAGAGEITGTIAGAQGAVKTLGTASKVAGGAATSIGNTAKHSLISGVESGKNILGKVTSKGSPSERALSAITPDTKDLTPTEYEDFLRQGKITPKTAKSPSQYILSESEKMNAQKYQHLIQDSDPVKNSINVMEDIAKKDRQVGEFLRRNNSIYSNGELKNSILERLKDVSDIMVDETRLEKLKNTITDGFIKALPKNDMETLWMARKSFDRSIEKIFGSSPTLQNTIKKEFRNSIQDFIAERTPKGVYNTAMKDMRELFDLHETISTKAVKEKGRNAMQVWIKNNPTKAKILGWGSTFVAGGGVVSSLVD